MQFKTLDIKEKVLLKNYCSFKIGGEADFFVEIKQKNQISAVFTLAQEKKIPLLFIGSGSNILFSDKGFRGIIVKMSNKGIKKNNNQLSVAAGEEISNFLLETAKMGIDFSDLAGIPGNIGGSIFGNAGAQNSAIFDFLESVEIFDQENFKILPKKSISFGYRFANFPKNSVIFSANFKNFPKNKPEKILEKIKKNIFLRQEKNPRGFSVGSFFRNPSSQIFAGKLIEESNCKELKIGDAQVAEKHANWIINKKNASAEEVIILAKKIVEKVYQKSKIYLQPEVKIFDEFGKKIALKKT